MIDALAKTAHQAPAAPDQPAPQGKKAPSEAAELENRFLQLLVAQIANQDPTKPVDSADFLNQFATLSQVKSLENMKVLSQQNLVLLDNLQSLSAAGLVGQDVKVQADHLQLSADAVQAGTALEHAADSVTLTLTDSAGIAHAVELGAQPKGPFSFQLDPVALGLLPGDYRAELSSGTGEKPRLEASGKVLNVRVSAEGPVLDIEGVGSVPFYQIAEFGTPPGTAIGQPLDTLTARHLWRQQP